MLNKPRLNNQIKAREVRLIDEEGKQLGVLPIEEALKLSREKGFDLIQVTEKVDPPVCKIMDHGKYLYALQKKERLAKHHHVTELKGVRLKFGISDHDLETKAKQATKFLEKGDKVRIEMQLRGRQKALKFFAEDKTNKFLEILKALTPIKIEKELKRGGRGLVMIISKDNIIHHDNENKKIN